MSHWQLLTFSSGNQGDYPNDEALPYQHRGSANNNLGDNAPQDNNNPHDYREPGGGGRPLNDPDPGNGGGGGGGGPPNPGPPGSGPPGGPPGPPNNPALNNDGLQFLNALQAISNNLANLNQPAPPKPEKIGRAHV